MLQLFSIITFVGVVLIGIIPGLRIKDSNEWAMGGRSLNWAAVAVLIAVFQIGGTSIMGAAQNGYVMGIAGSWYGIAGFISIGLTALFSSRLEAVLKVIHFHHFWKTDIMTELVNCITIYLISGFFYIPIQLFTLTTIIRMIIPGISLDMQQ